MEKSQTRQTGSAVEGSVYWGEETYLCSRLQRKIKQSSNQRQASESQNSSVFTMTVVLKPLKSPPPNSGFVNLKKDRIVDGVKCPDPSLDFVDPPIRCRSLLVETKANKLFI